MLKVGITVGCAAAMVLAAVLAVALRGTVRTASPLDGTERFRERLAVTAGRTGGMLLGAYVAGLLTIGAGSRLMMRVLASTSSDDAQGRRTDADEIVGDVTVGGSLFLVLVVGIGSAVVGLALFATLRRWLPDHSLVAGLVGVAIGAGALVRPTGLLTADNSDFTLLAPSALAVAFCIATLALFGATFGVLVDRLAPIWPRPRWSVRGALSVAPFAMLLISPPVFAASVIGVLAGTALPTVRSEAARRRSLQREVDDSSADRVGRYVVLGLGGVGALSVVVAAGQILAL